jgi:glycine cleavage system aminomethyltransferase T
LPAALVVPGTRVSVGVFGRDVGAEVRAEPLFDPGNEKVRA